MKIAVHLDALCVCTAGFWDRFPHARAACRQLHADGHELWLVYPLTACEVAYDPIIERLGLGRSFPKARRVRLAEFNSRKVDAVVVGCGLRQVMFSCRQGELGKFLSWPAIVGEINEMETRDAVQD